MEEDFLEYLKPLLRICRSFGLTYMNFDKSKINCHKVLNVLVRLLLLIVYFYNTYKYIVNLIISGELAQIYKIAGIVEIHGVIFCITFKWLYYFFKRKQMEEVILKVPYN